MTELKRSTSRLDFLLRVTLALLPYSKQLLS